MKAYKIFDTVMNVLLALIYLAFICMISPMFKIFPWYDPDGGYMLSMLLLWLPVCFLTIIQVAVAFIVKRVNKPLVILASLNAIYIPVIFLLGFVDISLLMLKLICVLAIITMITYVVLAFRRLNKLKKRNGDK